MKRDERKASLKEFISVGIVVATDLITDSYHPTSLLDPKRDTPMHGNEAGTFIVTLDHTATKYHSVFALPLFLENVMIVYNLDHRFNRLQCSTSD